MRTGGFCCGKPVLRDLQGGHEITAFFSNHKGHKDFTKFTMCYENTRLLKTAKNTKVSQLFMSFVPFVV